MLYRHWFSFFVKWVLMVNLDFRHWKVRINKKIREGSMQHGTQAVRT